MLPLDTLILKVHCAVILFFFFESLDWFLLLLFYGLAAVIAWMKPSRSIYGKVTCKWLGLKYVTFRFYLF